jgi:hypothetical protein
VGKLCIDVHTFMPTYNFLFDIFHVDQKTSNPATIITVAHSETGASGYAGTGFVVFFITVTSN